MGRSAAVVLVLLAAGTAQAESAGRWTFREESGRAVAEAAAASAPAVRLSCDSGSGYLRIGAVAAEPLSGPQVLTVKADLIPFMVTGEAGPVEADGPSAFRSRPVPVDDALVAAVRRAGSLSVRIGGRETALGVSGLRAAVAKLVRACAAP